MSDETAKDIQSLPTTSATSETKTEAKPPPGFKQTPIRCGNCGCPAILETPIDPADKTPERVLPHAGCID